MLLFEGSKGLIGLEGGQVSACRLDGEGCLRDRGRIRWFIKD